MSRVLRIPVLFDQRAEVGDSGKRQREREGPRAGTAEKGRKELYIGNNMATAIDDRQELLEQFQVVSPFVLHLLSFSGGGFLERWTAVRSLPWLYVAVAIHSGVQPRLLIDRRFYQHAFAETHPRGDCTGCRRPAVGSFLSSCQASQLRSILSATALILLLSRNYVPSIMRH